MPLRGSVRFLLPSFRGRYARNAVFGTLAACVAIFGATEFRNAFPAFERDGLAQTLRQSVWAEALSGQSTPIDWPWHDTTASMSIAPGASVPRLGLSAAMQIEPLPHATPETKTAETDTNKTVAGPVSGDVALRDVEIGDSITFTAADGATCVYRVTGRPVVDPHLAAGDAGRALGDPALFECGPLEDLIMRAARPKPAPVDDQQDL